MSTITRQDIIDTAAAQACQALAKRAWSEGNDQADGFEPSDEDKAGEIVLKAYNDNEVTIIDHGDRLVLVSDIDGPAEWAVEVR